MNQMLKASDPLVWGFTLIEVMVATAIFAIIMIAVTGIFSHILTDQRRAYSAQSLQENGLFILELMAREIRVSSVQGSDDTTCSLTSLTINHPVNGIVTYSLQNGVLKRTVTENGSPVTSDLSSSGIVFSRLNFCVLGSATNDLQAQRVAILASIQTNTPTSSLTTFNLETTITSRGIYAELQP